MLSWNVIMEDLNTRKITFHDIFKSGYWEEVAKKLKETFPNRKEWENHFRTRLMSRYGTRAEYEVVVTSWPPFINIDDIEKLQKEVEDREKTWGSKPHKVNINPTVAEKIDIFQQLDMNWHVFADYVWDNISSSQVTENKNII